MAARAGEYDYLGGAEAHMNRLAYESQQRKENCKQFEAHCTAQEKKIADLTKELEELQGNCDALESITAQLDKKTSSSLDARKMYGDVTPGDTTHQDVVLLYQNYFKAAFRSLPKDLQVQSKEDRYKLWQITSTIVEKCFKRNKDGIILEMMELMRAALEKPPPTDKTIDDNTADLYRAFHVFVREKLMGEKQKQDDKQESSGSKIKKELINELVTKNGRNHEAATEYVDLVTDVLTQLNPEDYHSFIEKGIRRKYVEPEPPVTKRSNSIDARQARAKEEKIKSECFACKKGFTKHHRDKPAVYHLECYWHQHHSTCARCKKQIEINNFKYYKEYDNTFCNQCLCNRCQWPLDDKALDTGHGLFHASCIACVHCKNITEDMIVIDGSFVCGNCHHRYHRYN